jgi:hypothetical protein
MGHISPENGGDIKFEVFMALTRKNGVFGDVTQVTSHSSLEEICSSKTSVQTRATLYNIPEDIRHFVSIY